MLFAIVLALQTEETLRALEKEIAAVRGLEFRSPVAARTIPRPKDAGRGVQGYYSLRDKTLYLYDDVQGRYERGVLVHEMVHALQDQHFGLAKLHEPAGGDEERARAALIEGDATFTMIEVLKGEQPKVAQMLDAPLVPSRDLERAFLYAQGARYVRTLRDRGGWEAVNRAYRSPPRSTAEILHPGQVQPVRVGPRARGEYEIIAMLASNADTAPLAVEAAAGWRGDAVSESTWEILFASPKDAREFQAAMAKLRRAQNPHLRAVLEEEGAAAWRGLKGQVLAVLARGERAFVLEAPDDSAFIALLDRLEGGALSLRIWSTKESRWLTFGEMVDRLLQADLICVGETHDSEVHHRIQLQILKAIYACDENVGVGMEMFQRPFQGAIDRYLAGETGEEEFLRASQYRERWGFSWDLYRPIAEFCRRNGVPLAALNAPRELTSRISKVGIEGLSAEERSDLGDVDLGVKAHRDHWLERLAKMHGNRTPTPEQKERSYQVMTVWDDYMAASAAAFQKERRLRRMVILAGSGHVDLGFGIPDRATKRTGGRAATVHITGGEPEPVADYIVVAR